MATQELTLNAYDEIVNKIQHDEDKTTYPSVYGNIVLPTVYAELDTPGYVRIIHDVERILDSTLELFGNGVNAGFLEVMDHNGIGLAAVSYFQENYHKLSSEVSFQDRYSKDKKAKTEEFNVSGVQHIFFINYVDGEVTVSNVSRPLQIILFGTVLFSNEYKISVDKFVEYVSDLKIKTNTTFNDAGVEITLQNYSNFYSLLFGFEAFWHITNNELGKIPLYSSDASNKELAIIASKGYNIDMLYLFHLNDYYPTDEELDELNKMPYNWRVAAINDR
jgi:hypothetical protein